MLSSHPTPNTNAIGRPALLVILSLIAVAFGGFSAYAQGPDCFDITRPPSKCSDGTCTPFSLPLGGGPGIIVRIDATLTGSAPGVLTLSSPGFGQKKISTLGLTSFTFVLEEANDSLTVVFQNVSPDQTYFILVCVNVGGGNVEIVCRPLDPPFTFTSSDPLSELVSNQIDDTFKRLGRHCYFLLTDSNGTQSTFAAYAEHGTRSFGRLIPKKDADYTTPPGGCVGGPLASDCIDVNLPTGVTFQQVQQDLERAVAAGPDGPYNPITNNCNLWAKNRIAELGLNVILPQTAISNKDEFCAQLSVLEQSLAVDGAFPLSTVAAIVLKAYSLDKCP